jgi:hypothetical protein
VEEDGEWTTGQRVYVPRITRDESVSLIIKGFQGDEDEPDPIVDLIEREFDRKGRLVREMFRSARLSELRDLPRRATKGGALGRLVRNLEPVYCGCGCGTQTSGTEFRQGHDAKLKSRLRRIAAGTLEGDVAAASAELERRKWNS